LDGQCSRRVSPFILARSVAPYRNERLQCGEIQFNFRRYLEHDRSGRISYKKQSAPGNLLGIHVYLVQSVLIHSTTTYLDSRLRSMCRDWRSRRQQLVQTRLGKFTCGGNASSARRWVSSLSERKYRFDAVPKSRNRRRTRSCRELVIHSIHAVDS
jgi:hypothetical protein